MSLAFCILGSGSSGNSTLVRFDSDHGRRHALIDCGLSLRATAHRLRRIGVEPSSITDIFLTHLDRDHFCPTWSRAAAKRGITLHLHRRQRSRGSKVGLNFRSIEVFDDEINIDAETRLEAVPLAHDQLGTVGFIIEHRAVRLGFATDLGFVPGVIYDRFVDLDALAFESNYDRRMQIESDRPPFLKKRIMGGGGHLSNEQALEAVREIAVRSRLAHLALLHLSQQCNCPDLVRSLYEKRAPDLAGILTVTSQNEPTDMLHVEGDFRPDGMRGTRRSGAAASSGSDSTTSSR